MGDNVLDNLFYRIKAKAGLCTPDMEDLAEYLEKAEAYTKRAKQATDFVKMSPDLPAELEKAGEAIATVHAQVSKAASAAGDVVAMCQISDAMSVLNLWAEGKVDNAVAAAAFDKLFGGLGRFVSKLPVPFNAYAKLFNEIAIAKFFSNMQRLGASRAGENTSTPTGRALKEVMDGMDK
jgi:hypothetical protein